MIKNWVFHREDENEGKPGRWCPSFIFHERRMMPRTWHTQSAAGVPEKGLGFSYI